MSVKPKTVGKLAGWRCHPLQVDCNLLVAVARGPHMPPEGGSDREPPKVAVLPVKIQLVGTMVDMFGTRP